MLTVSGVTLVTYKPSGKVIGESLLATITTHASTRYEDFNIQVYLEAEFNDQPAVKARLKFIPEAAFIAFANRSTWLSMHEDEDGSVEVVLAAPDLNWLASIVLSFGAWVRVLEPTELQRLVRDWALGTAELYREEESVK